jgi:hypothetical protein
LESVSYIDEDGIRRVDAISLAIPAGEHATLYQVPEGVTRLGLVDLRQV